MIKIKNFICPKCGEEREVYLNDDEEYEPFCAKCKVDLEPFNFAKHVRWRFVDEPK